MAELDYNYIAGLVKLAENGSSDAFAELYAATYDKQYKFSYCYLKDAHLAEDALQETYIIALKNISALRDPKLFVSWLNQINFRVCYGMANKQKLLNSETEAFSSGDLVSQASCATSPEERVIDIDSRKYLLQQILALPNTESQAILLFYYKNMKISDIAELLETSRSTIKRNLASGRKRLAGVVC